MTSRPFAFSVMASLSLLNTGCMTFRGPEALRQTVGRSQKITLKRESGITVNALGLWAAALFTDLSVSILHFSSMEAGVYEVTCDEYEGCPPFNLKKLALPDWQHFMYMRDGIDEVQILVQQNQTSMRSMAIFILHADELTLVYLKGNIHKFLESEDGADTLLASMDRIRIFLNRINTIQRLLGGARNAHTLHEAAIRNALQGSGWSKPANDAPSN